MGTKITPALVDRLGAAGRRVLDEFDALRSLVDRVDLSLTEREQVHDAVDRVDDAVAAVLAHDPDPNVPVQLGDPNTAGAPGSVVTIQAEPAPMFGPQGGVVDTDDDNPEATPGVPGVAQFVDLEASEPHSTATAVEGEATGRDVTEPDPAGDGTVTEPAPPPAAPVYETPTSTAADTSSTSSTGGGSSSSE